MHHLLQIRIKTMVYMLHFCVITKINGFDVEHLAHYPRLQLALNT